MLREMLRPSAGRVECWLGGKIDRQSATIKGGKLVYESPNLILNNYYSRLAYWLASNVQNAGTAILGPGYIAVGSTGTTVTPAESDLALGFEVKRQIISSAAVQSSYTARLVAAFGSTEANYNLSECGLFDAIGYDGTATAGTSTTMTDSGAAFRTTGTKLIGRTVDIIAGTGAGQSAIITANTATQVTVASWSIATPDATSKYAIGGVTSDQFMFAHAPISVNKVVGNALNVIWVITEPSF